MELGAWVTVRVRVTVTVRARVTVRPGPRARVRARATRGDLLAHEGARGAALGAERRHVFRRVWNLGSQEVGLGLCEGMGRG